MFTLDTESGFRDVVFITGAYGLGENIVQVRISPDEFYVFKPTLRQGYQPLIWKKSAAKNCAWFMTKRATNSLRMCLWPKRIATALLCRMKTFCASPSGRW